jgi:hypothetical protein
MAKRRPKPRELSPTELSRMLHHAERVMECLRMF